MRTRNFRNAPKDEYIWGKTDSLRTDSLTDSVTIEMEIDYEKRLSGNTNVNREKVSCSINNL